MQKFQQDFDYLFLDAFNKCVEYLSFVYCLMLLTDTIDDKPFWVDSMEDDVEDVGDVGDVDDVEGAM